MPEYSLYRFTQMTLYNITNIILIYLFANRFIKNIQLSKRRIFKVILGIVFLLFFDYLSFISSSFIVRLVGSFLYSGFSILVHAYTLLGKRDLTINFTKVLFIGFLLTIPDLLSIFIVNDIFKASYYESAFAIVPILHLIMGLVFYYLIKKIDLKILVEDIFDKRKNRILFVLFYLLFYLVALFIMTTSIRLFYLIALFTLVVVFFFFYHNNNNKNKKLNETIINQQESYISSLESMQEDIRKYNRDYKNLLTGALLQAEEGDYEGVQNYLQDVLDEFELKLGKQISKNTQLKKINSNELKGLLLSKISEMEDKNIEFHLEVLNEVSKINMKSTDLVRCLGMLLDNAIEEVEKIEEKIISLIILQEENITTIMVKNPVTEKVNIQSIYEDNFSTKGEKRGLGLSNYREIIENYENIVRETICTEEEFTQVLKIG